MYDLHEYTRIVDDAADASLYVRVSLHLCFLLVMRRLFAYAANTSYECLA